MTQDSSDETPAATGSWVRRGRILREREPKGGLSNRLPGLPPCGQNDNGYWKRSLTPPSESIPPGVDRFRGLPYDISIDLELVIQEGMMLEVTISPKYQVVIPKAIREELGLKTGQKLIALAKAGVVYLIPAAPLARLRGVARGMDLSDLRDEADRL
jgi:AbrB family looped-hinge helix DNA binding protein